jgi:hypothetical protein
VDASSNVGGFGGGGSCKTQLPEDECEVLANVVLSHVPVENFDFRAAVYIGHTVRRGHGAFEEKCPDLRTAMFAVLRPKFAQSPPVTTKNTAIEAPG